MTPGRLLIAEVLGRARAQAADLAHALKNPLTVVGNEAQRLPPGPRKVLLGEVSAMRAAIERHLSRARTAGRSPAAGARTAIEPVVRDLEFSLRRLYPGRELEVGIGDLEGLTFAGDPEDLEEMLGNVMDNAWKWARHHIRIRGEARGNHLAILVEDDGPGIPADRHTDVLARGGRLDETVPGSGLGLAMTGDIAAAYGGTLELAASDLGGLRVTLRLPGGEIGGTARGGSRSHELPGRA